MKINIFSIPESWLGSAVCCCISISLAAQGTWTISEGGPQSEVGHSLCRDDLGNIFVAGQVSAGTSVGGAQFNERGVFIIKYDSSGALLWVRGLTDPLSENHGIETDSRGNVYVVGSFRDSAFIGNVKLTSNADYDYYIAKFGSAGDLMWAVNGGSDKYGEDDIRDIAIDHSDNIYVTGRNDTVGFFIARYDTNGTAVWTSTGASNYGSEGHGIAVGKDGGIYSGGYFTNFIIVGDSTYYPPGSGRYPYVSKYDSLGNPIWFRTATNGDSVRYNEGWALSAFPSGGCILTGDRTPKGIRGKTIFVCRYDSNGDLLWSKDLGDDRFEVVYGVEVANDGRILVSGTSGGDSEPTTHITGTKATIYALDSLGNELWTFRQGSDQDIPTGYPNSVHDVEIDGNHIYFTGSFKGNFHLYPSYLSSAGGADMYVAKRKLSADIGTLEIPRYKYYRVFPNPFSDFLKIEFREVEEREIKLLTMTGKVVRNETAFGNVEVNVAELPRGVYVLQISDNKGLVNFRVLKR